MILLLTSTILIITICIIMETLVNTKEITIIDLGKIANATFPLELSKEVLKLSDDLKEAFSHRKVVYIINHDISEEETKNMYSSMKKFFALPQEIKDKYTFDGKGVSHGYLPPNTEQFSYDNKRYEIRESFNIIGKECDYLPEKEIPEFSQCVSDITKKLLSITNILLQLIAIGLDIEQDFLVNCHKGLLNHRLNTSTFRLLYYPKVEEDPHPGIIRCGEHTDYGTFTLLLQDSEGGLEVCGENGEWRRVGHIPGAIFLNTADLLEIWSSGKYKATLHRVVVPEEKHLRNRSRYSMVQFVQPDISTIIKPLHPPPGVEVKGFNSQDYVMNRVDWSDPQKREYATPLSAFVDP